MQAQLPLVYPTRKRNGQRVARSERAGGPAKAALCSTLRTLADALAGLACARRRHSTRVAIDGTAESEYASMSATTTILPTPAALHLCRCCVEENTEHLRQGARAARSSSVTPQPPGGMAEVALCLLALCDSTAPPLAP